jgi:hypothetical protein
MVRSALARADDGLARWRTRGRLLWPWFAGLVVCVALGYVFVRLLPPSRECGTVGCSVGLSLLSTVLGIAASGAVFLIWVRGRALRRYLKESRRDPNWLRRGARRVDLPTVQERPDFYRTIEDEMTNPSAGPQLVVGDAGAGKSTFIVVLARHLARRGWIPVVVPLRGETVPIDLHELARDHFLSLVDRQLGSGSHGDRLWRQLWKRRLIVVLADGLDESLLDGGMIERDDLRDDGAPCVITSRPSSLASDLRRAAFPLPPLPQDNVERLLTASAKSPERVEGLVKSTQLARTPYFIDLARDLLAADLVQSARKPPSVDAARAALVDHWLDAVAARDLLDHVDLDTVDRADAISVAQLAAAVAIIDDEDRPARTTILERVSAVGGGVLPRDVHIPRAIRNAARLGLLDELPGGILRFRHPILRAALASTAVATPVRDCGDLYDQMMDGRVTEDILLTLRYAVAVGRLEAERVVPVLRSRIGDSRRHDTRLAIAAAAARISLLTANETQAGVLADVEEHYPLASTWARTRGLDALAVLGTDPAIQLMWQLSGEGSYFEAWRMVQRLSERPTDSFVALHEPLAGLIEAAEQSPDTKIDPQLDERCKATAKFLPHLTERLVLDGADGAGASTELLRRLFDRMRAWIAEDQGYGLEASFGQGFKNASWHPTSGQLDAFAIDLVANGAFWYARAMSAQAIALQLEGVDNDEPRSAALRNALEQAADDDHPFVAEAARLGLRGVREGRVRRYVWEDESTTVARSGIELAPATGRLLGRLVLMLNMNEQLDKDDPGDQERLDRTQRAVAKWPAIPHCLSNPNEFWRLTAPDAEAPGCTAACGFELCPYRPKTARAIAFRGTPSPAFCRLQRQHLAWADRLRPRRRRAARGLWRELEKVS